MNPKQIEVSCPCCATRLTIDVLTSRVLRSASPAERDETGKIVLDENRWDRANTKVKDRGERGQDVFDAALSKEKSREKDLDELFDKARKKAKREPDGGKPPA
jgi:hypothetical protein